MRAAIAVSRRGVHMLRRRASAADTQNENHAWRLPCSDGRAAIAGPFRCPASPSNPRARLTIAVSTIRGPSVTLAPGPANETVLRQVARAACPLYYWVGPDTIA